jgi:predicted Zn-dependent protease
MAKAGYDPRAAIGFWERMAQATGGGGQGVMDRYLSTHPSNSDRINKIKSALPEAEKYSLAPKR